MHRWNSLNVDDDAWTRAGKFSTDYIVGFSLHARFSTKAMWWQEVKMWLQEVKLSAATTYLQQAYCRQISGNGALLELHGLV